MALMKAVAAYWRQWDEPIYKEVVVERVEHEDGTVLEIKETVLSHHEKRSEWVPQQTVEMSPLEEAEVRATWAKGEARAALPRPPTEKQQLEWVREGGDALLKKMMDEHESERATKMVAYEEAKAAHAQAYHAYLNSK